MERLQAVTVALIEGPHDDGPEAATPAGGDAGQEQRWAEAVAEFRRVIQAAHHAGIRFHLESDD